MRKPICEEEYPKFAKYKGKNGASTARIAHSQKFIPRRTNICLSLHAALAISVFIVVKIVLSASIL
jgi:hypothetical protein